MKCALSQEPVIDPVVSPKSGQIFERSVILKYLDRYHKDPATNEPLEPHELIRLCYKPESSSPLESIPQLLESLKDAYNTLVLSQYERSVELKETKDYADDLESTINELRDKLTENDKLLASLKTQVQLSCGSAELNSTEKREAPSDMPHPPERRQRNDSEQSSMIPESQDGSVSSDPRLNLTSTPRRPPVPPQPPVPRGPRDDSSLAAHDGATVIPETPVRPDNQAQKRSKPPSRSPDSEPASKRHEGTFTDTVSAYAEEFKAKVQQDKKNTRYTFNVKNVPFEHMIANKNSIIHHDTRAGVWVLSSTYPNIFRKRFDVNYPHALLIDGEPLFWKAEHGRLETQFRNKVYSTELNEPIVSVSSYPPNFIAVATAKKVLVFSTALEFQKRYLLHKKMAGKIDNFVVYPNGKAMIYSSGNEAAIQKLEGPPFAFKSEPMGLLTVNPRGECFAAVVNHTLTIYGFDSKSKASVDLHALPVKLVWDCSGKYLAALLPHQVIIYELGTKGLSKKYSDESQDELTDAAWVKSKEHTSTLFIHTLHQNNS